MILVTGATGYLGRRVVRRLCERHEQVRCLVRATSDTSELEHLEVEIHVGDLEDRPSACPAFRDADAVIHLAHIRYAPVVLESASPGVSRIVLLSSLRALSRVPSSSVTDVRTGEAAARASRLPWILLRPSMIYGPGDDRNISRLADFLRRHRIFPVLCDGRTLQQPVFVEDVVQAVLAAAAGQGHPRNHEVVPPP
ncbi:MAG: NAD-dependent epimerase/dehydratase family protein [Planctomycetota bacterium]